MHIKTREELLGTVINEVPYGWMVVPEGQLLKDTDLFVSGWWGRHPRGRLLPAALEKNQKSYTIGIVFGCSYIRPIEEDETTEIKRKFYYLVDPDNNKVVGIVDDSRMDADWGDDCVFLEITSKDRISKIQELFKI